MAYPPSVKPIERLLWPVYNFIIYLMAQIKPQTLTLSEFLALLEEKPPREYSDGQITTKPMPKGKHSALQTELSLMINGALKRDKDCLGAFSNPPQ
jgi:Uma2 family endonuclease